MLDQEHDVSEHSAFRSPVYALLPHRSIRRVPVLLEILGQFPVRVEGERDRGRHCWHHLGSPSCNLESFCSFFRDRVFQKGLPLDILNLEGIRRSSSWLSPRSRCLIPFLVLHYNSSFPWVLWPSLLPRPVVPRVLILLAVQLSLLDRFLSFLGWRLDDDKIFSKDWFCLRLRGNLANSVFLWYFFVLLLLFIHLIFLLLFLPLKIGRFWLVEVLVVLLVVALFGLSELKLVLVVGDGAASPVIISGHFWVGMRRI